MSDTCIFCQIVQKKIQAKILIETEKSLLFSDVNPQAPVHLLAIPKLHIPDFSEMSDPSVMADLMQILQQGAEQHNLRADGYRLVVNTGKNGGQTVFHLHFHLLGGRRLKWPPG